MARFHCISILNIRARLNRRQCVVYSVRVLCTVRTPYFNLTVYTNIRTLLRYIQYTYISHCTNRENLYIKRANSLFVWVNQVCDARYVCAVSRAYKLIHNTHTCALIYSQRNAIHDVYIFCLTRKTCCCCRYHFY